jgi:hypothetical protein
MGSLREVRRQASRKSMSSSFASKMRFLGMYRVISAVKMETQKSWEEEFYMRSLENLYLTLQEYYGNNLEKFPTGLTYTITFKENDLGQLSMRVEPDDVLQRTTTKVEKNFFIDPKDLVSK